MELEGELQIDLTQVVREYWEILVLKGLYDSPYGRKLIFKGGTALRLAYDSPRFSEDLDFSLTSDPFKDKFSKLNKKIVAPFPELAISDLEEKYYTYLAEIKVTHNYLPFPFRIKIEISKRRFKNYQWNLHLLTSPVTTVMPWGRLPPWNNSIKTSYRVCRTEPNQKTCLISGIYPKNCPGPTVLEKVLFEKPKSLVNCGNICLKIFGRPLKS